jgi:hypothetical protein
MITKILLKLPLATQLMAQWAVWFNEYGSKWRKLSMIDNLGVGVLFTALIAIAGVARSKERRRVRVSARGTGVGVGRGRGRVPGRGEGQRCLKLLINKPSAPLGTCPAPFRFSLFAIRHCCHCHHGIRHSYSRSRQSPDSRQSKIQRCWRRAGAQQGPAVRRWTHGKAMATAVVGSVGWGSGRSAWGMSRLSRPQGPPASCQLLGQSTRPTVLWYVWCFLGVWGGSFRCLGGWS